jgi:hypothetical protein
MAPDRALADPQTGCDRSLRKLLVEAVFEQHVLLQSDHERLRQPRDYVLEENPLV